VYSENTILMQISIREISYDERSSYLVTVENVSHIVNKQVQRIMEMY